MAKKPSAKTAKKAKRPVKGAAKSKRPASAGRAKQRSDKYSQAGAPWWKQYLPR